MFLPFTNTLNFRNLLCSVNTAYDLPKQRKSILKLICNFAMQYALKILQLTNFDITSAREKYGFVFDLI